MYNQTAQFHKDNYLKIKRELLEKDITKIQYSKLAEMGEVIGSQIFTYLVDVYSKELDVINNQFEFTQKYTCYDAYTKDNIYEIKCRKISLSQHHIRDYSPLKISKYQKYKGIMPFATVYYLMICFDRIFIYNVSKFEKENDYRMNNKNCWKYLDSKNDKNNINKAFIGLKINECVELEFSQKTKDDLESYFHLIESIENYKVKLNNRKYKNKVK